ncbi:hypothetical protein VHUM_00719 [Vanrija humicola]|uniref:Chromatin modification-related protein n=1 Tax=Vanrija humicola TaxID=5417 RepID=A0A7D8Z5R1_VANHU|nr:hypothetical protein VHUM_00719 [Vanrija humicola]
MAGAQSQLHVYPHFNHEEAAAVAAEFVQSLDNLQGEVTFLLQEIREKDERIGQLLNRINQRHYGLTKSIKNLSSANATPSTATFTLPIPAGAALPTAHLSTKDAQNVAKIQTEWGKIESLQAEKIKLAERLERIVLRARERGKNEWHKVGGMDIDELDTDGLGSGSDARHVKRRNKPGNMPLAAAISAGSSMGTLVGSPGSMPPPPAPRAGSVSRATGGSRGARAERHQSIATTMSDVDADGEVEMADGGDVEADDAIYCFCQQKSYGEMIGCDNDKCQFEWFHVKCVNINGQLPDTWYCPDCVQKLGLSSSDGKVAKDRKGRRK